MSATSRDKTYFAEVAALTTVANSDVVPAGKTWEVSEFVGSAAYQSSTKAILVWDYSGAGETIIFSTHGDGRFLSPQSFQGDGAKKLAICLVNDSLVTQTLGGSYKAKEYTT